MDSDILQGVAAVLGVMIPILAIAFGGLHMLSRSRLGEALARRIGGDAGQAEVQGQLDALHDDVAGLRAQLEETQERLDFAERALTRGEDTRREPGTPGRPDSPN